MTYFYYDGDELKKAAATTKTDAPTCTEAEQITYTVKVNGETIEYGPVDKEGGKPAKGHDWGEPYEEIIKEPTCEEEGSYVMVRKCKREGCGETETVSEKPVAIPAKGHTPKDPEVVAKEAGNCTDKDGWVEYVVKCQDCGEEIETYRETIPAGHIEGAVKKENEKKATCKEAGSYEEVVYCDRCGEELSRTKVEVPALTEHKWDQGKVTKKATCKEDGVKTYTCTVCGENKTETIKATGKHQPGDWELARDGRFQDATCEEPGRKVMIRKCKVCGEEVDESEPETIPAKGHKWELTDVKRASTCTQEGLGDYVCSVCGKTDRHEIPMHTPGEAVKENVKKATCTENEEYDLVVRCTVCKEILESEHVEVEDSALGHKWGKPVRENEKIGKTCEDETSYDSVVYCDVCGEEKEGSRNHVVIPAKEHQWVTVETQEVSCTKPGAILKKCSVCNKVEREETQPALGHDEETVITNETATCTEPGTHDVKVTCKRCGKVLSEEKKVASEALGHDYKLTYTKAPTCTESGEGYGKCSRCGDLTASKEIDALGHDYQKTDAKVTWSAEYDDDKASGYVEYTFTCKNNSEHTYTTLVPFTTDETDADFKCTYTVKVTKEPTCKAEGEKTFEAVFTEKLANGKTVTSPHTYKETLGKTGHAWANPVKEKEKAATCTKDGSYELAVYCATCGKEDKTKREKVNVKALGHKPGEKVQENHHNKDFAESDSEDWTFEWVEYCTVCGEELSREPDFIPATGHKFDSNVFVYENVVEPTCFANGKRDKVWYCVDEKCKDKKVELKRVEEILYGGHEWPDYPDREYIKEPTCTEDGTYVSVWRCTVCGEELDRGSEHTEKAHGHSAFYTRTVVTKEPTCTEPGAQADVTYCGVCFEEVGRSKETAVSATGHFWDAGVVTKEATAEEKGEMTYTCTVCGETRTEEIDNSGLIKKESTIVLNNKLVYYNGKVQAFDTTDAKVNGSKGAVTFEYFADSKCTKKISAPKDCGNYYAKATVAADAAYAGATSSVAKLRILRVFRGFSVAGKTVTVSAASVKNSNQMIPQSKAVTLRKGNDQVKFVKAIWTYNSPITVDRSGNIQLRKGLKPGTYTVKCKAFTPATRNYLRTVKVYTVTIKVK